MSKNIGRKGIGLKYLGLRNGKKWWQARLFWVDSRTGRNREKLATYQADSKALAMQRRDELLAQAKEEAAELGGQRKRFREVADERLAEIKVHATWVGASSMCRTLSAHFGDWFVDAMTPRAMQDYLDALTIASVNNIRAELINVFRVAVRKRYVRENAAKKTERRRDKLPEYELDDAPEQALTAEQVAAYLDDLEEHEPDLYPVIFLSFMLGCRYSEATALRHEDIDLEAGTVKIRRGQYRGRPGRTKGKRARLAGLSMESRAVLHAHLERMRAERWPGFDELVFPRPAYGRTRPSNHWASTTVDEKIRKSFGRCGIAVKGTTHVGRHTAITMADDVGVPESVQRKVFGHRSKRIHQGYKHPRPAQVIDFGEAVGQKLTGSRTGTKTGTRSAELGDELKNHGES